MAGQINIAKGYGQTIPPTGYRGYSFDNDGNPIIVLENGTTQQIGGGGSTGGGTTNVIANLGLGLASALPSNPVLGDIYVGTDSFKYYECLLAGTWNHNILVKNQFITDTSLADKTLYQYDGSQLVQLTFPATGITGDEIVDLLEALTADNRLDASAIKNLPTESAVGGFASNVYFSNTDSDILGYKRQSSTVDVAETILTPSVQLSDGNKLVNQYVFDLPANVNLIQQGNWSFTFASFVSSSTGETRLGFRPFRYTALGVKTYTFSDIVWSDELNQLTREYKTVNLIQESKAIELTDRLGCDLYIKTSSSPAITVNIVIGDGQALFMNVPIAIRHSAMRDLNGDPNYQHITQAEKNIIPLNSSAFNGNLTPDDNTLQKIADKVDDLIIPQSTTIDVETLEPYDPLQLYDAGVYKSYVNLESSDPQFQSPAIYLSMFAVGVGQTPESHPYDPDTNTGFWWYLGSDPVEVTSRATAKTTVFSEGELRAIEGAKSGDTCNILDSYLNIEITYKFDINSTASEIPYQVVKPLDGNGRWLAKGIKNLQPSFASYSLPYEAGFNYGLSPNKIHYYKAVDLRPNAQLFVTSTFATTSSLYRSEEYAIFIDNSINTVDLAIILNIDSNLIEWVDGVSTSVIKAGKKVYLTAKWMLVSTGVYKLLIRVDPVNEEVSGVANVEDLGVTTSLTTKKVLKVNATGDGVDYTAYDYDQITNKAATFTTGNIKCFDANGNDCDTEINSDYVDIYDLTVEQKNYLSTENNWLVNSEPTAQINTGFGLQGNRYTTASWAYECYSDGMWVRYPAGVAYLDIYDVNSTAVTLITTSGNWTGSVYTGTAITGTKKGQRYISSTYVYEFYDDNLPCRYLRS
jgi:hypothetical protein